MTETLSSEYDTGKFEVHTYKHAAELKMQAF